MPHPAFLTLAAPIEPESPSGPDPTVATLPDPADPGRTITVDGLLARVEAQVRDWAPADPGRPPPDGVRDWASLSNLCKAGLGRCRHLRLAAYLCLAEVEFRGLAGLQGGLEFIAALLEGHWPTLHPGPPGVDRQLSGRRNALRMLGARALKSDDPDAFIARLLRVPFDSTNGRDARFLDVAVGHLSWPQPVWVPDADRAKEAQACKDRLRDFGRFDPEGRLRAQATLKACLAAVDRINAVYEREQVPEERVPNLSFLRELLDVASTAMDDVPPSDDAAPVQAPTQLGTSPAPTPAPGSDWRLSITIASESDVRLALSKVIQYLGRNKSNPAPLFFEAGLAVIERPYDWLLKNVPTDTVAKLTTVRDADRQETPPASS